MNDTLLGAIIGGGATLLAPLVPRFFDKASKARFQPLSGTWILKEDQQIQKLELKHRKGRRIRGTRTVTKKSDASSITYEVEGFFTGDTVSLAIAHPVESRTLVMLFRTKTAEEMTGASTWWSNGIRFESQINQTWKKERP